MYYNKEENEEVCIWKFTKSESDNTDHWISGCGRENISLLPDWVPAEEGYQYCAFCNKFIVVEKT